ncbi:endo-1,4-beta-xylanase xylA, putative (macronuclear) [Tetrahymena thermophila SB210]|uniref:Endo-1,4-beta-xylanase xylA, putative n=1 Tax=Tetrahymena thermophila (strain SB210) TaxID=312017 RepID=I7LTB6_TETTS|nr:endo-1,4-beta-xylanase xylA, putative [Tetrahymena thermophila SB210]EAR84949.1 endo-1,4-beta-xylanase xylA, putative [Tetrahymena thermophila SB210]|eukprot:XP_001032612.1 endo-1,4-beta-xylanase xylA, putative [Tetrahymena thermophila SB210]
MNPESNRQERYFSQLNIPISLVNIPTGKGRSSSNLNAMIDQIEQNQILSPVNKKVPQSVSLPKKIDNIKRKETRTFSVKKMVIEGPEINSQNLKHSHQYDILNSNARTSTNFKMKNEDTNHAIQQFKILRDQLQNNFKNQFESPNNSTALPTSSIRFIFKEKEEQQNDSQEEKEKPKLQQLQNGMRKSTEAIKNRRYQSNLNQDTLSNASNFCINDQMENNLKKSFAEKNTSKQQINGQNNAYGRKCISSRDIQLPNMQNSFQISQLQSQDILNPLKQQMSSFIGSKNPKENNGKIFSLNCTPQKKIYSEIEQMQNQNQGNQSTQLQTAKNPSDNEHKKNNAGSSAANTAYKNYLNRIIQKQQQLYDKPNQFEFSSSDGTPGSSTLRNYHQANSLNSTKYFDNTQKKSIMHNIFLKDKDQVSLEEFSLRSKKQEAPDSSNGKIELPPLMFPASKKDLDDFQKLQNKDELRFSREHKQNYHYQEEYKGAQSTNNSIGSQEDKAQRKKQFSSVNSLSSFFKHKSDSLRIMELVQERNQIIQQQKLKQQEENFQHENKQNQQFVDLIKENMNNRFSSPQSNKFQNKGRKAQSQAIIVTDVSEIIKHRQNPSITNLPLQNQVSPQRGSQQLIQIPSKLQNTITNIAINNNGDFRFQSPQATFTQFKIKKQKTDFNKGSLTLKSIGSHQNFDIDSDELISQQQKAQHVETCEKELAKETNFVDYLQQKKIYIRQGLEQFLRDRPRVFKNILRNCLMDQEQFVFFMMSFIQFCIDDMFDEFKKEYYIKLAQNNRANDRISLINIPCNSVVESESTQFKFGQKIPEEIMKQVIDVIVNCLQKQSKEIKKQSSIEEFHIDNVEQELQKQPLQQRKSQESYNGENDEQSYIKQGLDRFFKKIQSNVEKYILPQTLIDKLGGFVRLRLLLVAGVKTFNNYINNASKMSYVEEDDDNLIDKYLMPFFCALINEDRETIQMQIGIFKQYKHSLSHYDFFSIKKIFWDTLNTIKLDPKLRNQVILSFENIRSEFFDNPFEKRLKELGQSMMKSYELCNYFRNPNPADNQIFLATLLPVLYKNVPYQNFYQANQQRLKFSLNDRFFDHLQKFLLEELKETDSKSILDLQIRISKLRIRAGVTYNFFQIINEDSETFFSNIFPFLSNWIQKYNLTQMDSKAQDFKFLEIFIKLCLNKQDYYSLMDSEPCLMHYVVNEFMISFWIKGISAYFEDKQVSKSQYIHLINFLSQYLLFKKEENPQKQNKN